LINPIDNRRHVLSKEIVDSAGALAGHPQEGAGEIEAQGPGQVLQSLFSRVLQSSIEKKRNTNKQTIKDSRAVPVYKPAETAVKPTRAGYEPLSLFNNEQLNTIEGGEFKFKKYNNRRLDKLVSLIQYMVSSSEKAVKYISSTNF
jgi:hypothetical protein